MTYPRKRTIVFSLIAVIALAGGSYWQVERLRAQRKEAADRAAMEEKRIDSIANIDAAKAAFSRILADVGTVVDQAVKGSFSFKKADTDTLRVLHQMLVDKPAPRCFGPARLASLNAVEAATRFLGSTVIDAPSETLTDEDRDRARELAESAPAVVASIAAARQKIEVACNDWLRENANPPR